MVVSLSATHYRGAVRPPFIEGIAASLQQGGGVSIGGQSAPPSLKAGYSQVITPTAQILSGGSPPPLH